MIYLASPYSAVGDFTDAEAKKIRHMRYQKTMCAQAALFGAGYPIFSTIVHTHITAQAYNLPTDATFWMSYNCHMMDLSRAVFILELAGWMESRGVNAEIEYAYGKDIPTYNIQIEDERRDTMTMYLPFVSDLCLRKPLASTKLLVSITDV